MRLTLAEWLKAADPSLSLDTPNDAVAPSLLDSSRYPYFRTTGLVVILDVTYSNIKKSAVYPTVGFVKEVHATVKPKVEKARWAGLAVKAPIYEALPTGPAGQQTYKKLLRYSQGVVFKFSGKGYVYRFDIVFFVTQLTTGLVLLSLATTVTGYVAKYLWPTRRMIYNKATERLAVGTRLAEIALKTATHAVNFRALKDGASRESLRASDLADAFSSVLDEEQLSAEQALQLATMCIARANDDPTDDLAAKQQMDFIEYMRGMEAGSMISFDRFKDVAATRLQKGKGSMARIVPKPEIKDTKAES